MLDAVGGRPLEDEGREAPDCRLLSGNVQAKAGSLVTMTESRSDGNAARLCAFLSWQGPGRAGLVLYCIVLYCIVLCCAVP
jgi:hypothetical protein